MEEKTGWNAIFDNEQPKRDYIITHPPQLCLQACNLHMQLLYKVLHKKKLSKMNAHENIPFLNQVSNKDVLFLNVTSLASIHRYVCQSLSRVRFLATPWTGTYQTPLSVEFSRQEYWSGLPFPSPGIDKYRIALMLKMEEENVSYVYQQYKLLLLTIISMGSVAEANFMEGICSAKQLN